jgi:hypothetical protein
MTKPTTHVARLALNDPGDLKTETLERLRSLKSAPMPTKHWRMEDFDSGRVLAEQKGGDVIIYRDACRDLLGEEV